MCEVGVAGWRSLAWRRDVRSFAAVCRSLRLTLPALWRLPREWEEEREETELNETVLRAMMLMMSREATGARILFVPSPTSDSAQRTPSHQSPNDRCVSLANGVL